MFTFFFVNTLIFIGTLFLTFVSILNFQLIMTLPFGVIGVFCVGFLTVILNLYEAINNFVMVFTILPKKEDNEDKE